MRREGYIIEEIIEYSNMSEAFDSVLRGTDRKRSRQGRFLLAHREKIITELTASIADGSFRLGGYHEREIEEYGKKRILQIGTYAIHQVMCATPFDTCSGCPNIAFLQMTVYNIHYSKHSNTVFHRKYL